MKYATRTLAIALLYFAFGYIGSFFSIPSGVASAIWLPSGLSLAAVLHYGYKYVPAVFLGSFIHNIYVANLHSRLDEEHMVLSMSLAVIIALGMALQVSVSAYLVNRFANIAQALNSLKAILYLFLYGSLIGCLVNAAISNLALLSFGQITLSSFTENFVTWWIGDALGVIVLTPTLLLLFAPSKFVKQARKLTVISITLLSFVLLAYFYNISKNQQEKEIYMNFKQTAVDLTNGFHLNINRYLDILDSVDSFVGTIGYQNVNYEIFKSFVSPFFKYDLGIQAISWNQKVLLKDRKAFEMRIRQEAFPGFIIKDRFSIGNLGQSPDRPFYYPVTYTYPYESNKRAHGFDTYSLGTQGFGKQRIKALDEGIKTAEVQSTGRLSLVQAEDEYGLLFYNPVFEKTGKHVGYVAGVFLVNELIKKTVTSANQNGIKIVLKDLSAAPEKQILYDFRSKENLDLDLKELGLYFSNKIDIAGSEWQIEFAKERKAISFYDSIIWWILIGGFLFIALLNSFLLAITGRHEVTKEIVKQKTASLNHMVDELSKSNEDLERFAYVASHDLKEPVRIVSNYSTMLEANYSDFIDEKGKKYLKHINKANLRMKNLINGLLEYARINNDSMKLEEIDSQKSMSHALDNLSGLIEDSKADIEVAELPVVRADPVRLSLVLQNLISNAIKYQVSGKTSSVKVSANSDGDDWIFCVEDNGIGIEKQYQDKIFDIFTRLHSKDEYSGTGIGLAMCKKIIEGFDGKIWLESEPGKGSKFYFSLPKASKFVTAPL